MGLSVPGSAHRCHARDGNGDRCTHVGPHETITNSEGKPAIVHETRYSLWSVPIMVVLTDTLEAP